MVGKEKKDRVMSARAEIVSYHEVGHAMVTALQKNTEPVQKITIVPRTMGALGVYLADTGGRKIPDIRRKNWKR